MAPQPAKKIIGASIAGRDAVARLALFAYRHSRIVRTIGDTLDPPIGIGHVRPYAEEGEVEIDGEARRMLVATVRVTNFGPDRFLRLAATLSDPGGSKIVDSATLDPPDAPFAGAGRRLTDRAPFLPSGRTVTVPVIAMSGPRGESVVTVLTHHRDQLSLNDGDHCLWIDADHDGIGLNREFRLYIGNDGTTMSLIDQPIDRRLSTRSPGWWWLCGVLLMLGAVAAVSVLSEPTSSALIRAGLASDIWGVWMLSWPLFLRQVEGTPGTFLGGGKRDGDDDPAQRNRDRAAVRSRLAVTWLVVGFALQIAGQSM